MVGGLCWRMGDWCRRWGLGLEKSLFSIHSADLRLFQPSDEV